MIVLPAMSPLLAPGGAELRAEEWLDLTGLFDPVALAALGGALLLVVVLTVLVGWLAWRRVRRTALAGRGGELTAFGREVGARGRELGVQSAAALAALRLPPGGRRTTAELHLQLSRARSRLRRQLTAARAGGAHLGDVPALMPTLEAEGNRLEGRLRQWALAPAIESAGPAGPVELEAEVRAHLVMLTEVSEAVLHAAAPAASSRQLAADVDDAVSGLRAHAAAYRELTNPLAPPPPARAAGPSSDRGDEETVSWNIALGVLGGLVSAWLVLVAALLISRPAGGLLKEALRLLPDMLRLLRRLAADSSLPRGVRWRLGLLFAYLAIPIDLIPDFIPVLGYADDAIIVAATLRSVVRRAGMEPLRRHWPGTDDGLAALARLAGLPGIPERPDQPAAGVDGTIDAASA